MKKTVFLFLSILISLISINLYAQEISLKYGKITEHEVKMNTYEADTSAAAVVLFEEKFVRFI